MELEDIDEVVKNGRRGKNGEHEERVDVEERRRLQNALGLSQKLSLSDISQKDVFAARMQDVMTKRKHRWGEEDDDGDGEDEDEAGRRQQEAMAMRYLAPERRGNIDLDVDVGMDLGDLGNVGNVGKLGRTHDAHHHAPPSFLEVTLLTIGMALSAGFGALPFFFVSKLSPLHNGLATAIACGVMFAASFDLIHEGQPYGPSMVVLGIGIGAVFIKYMQKYLDSLGDVSFGKLHGPKAKRLILIVGIMAAHAIGEGCGVGVSFVGEKGFDQGLLTTLAIGIHNVPEGMAKATVLVSQGATAWEALFWSVVTCLPQPLTAVPAFVFVTWFEFLLPVSLGFAAGCMIWMVFAELLPDALKDCDAGRVASAATFSAAGLEGLRMMMEGLDATYGGAGGEEVFEDRGERGWELSGMGGFSMPQNLKVSFGLVLVVVSVVTSWVPHMARIADATIPVVLGMVSVVMGLIGVLPIARDLVVDLDAPRVHVMAAAAIGMVGIVLLRNVILDRGYAMLVKRREKGDGFLGGMGGMGGTATDGSFIGPSNGHGNGSSASAMNNHRLPSMASKRHRANLNSPHPPLRALSVILVVTSILHAMVCGAQLQRVGPEYGDFAATSRDDLSHDDGKSLSLAAAYAGLFGIVAGCSSFLWELTDSPSILRSSLVATLISSACVLAHQAVLLPSMHRLILPYPRGVLDTLSYVAHGALAMTALLTLAVGMTSQPRYTRFGVLLAWFLLCGWAFALWIMGTDVVGRVLSL